VGTNILYIPAAKVKQTDLAGKAKEAPAEEGKYTHGA